MAWDLVGNAASNPAIKFVGTTVSEPLVIRTNGTEQVRITSAVNVGIATPEPGRA
jgi:hypothetical protein